MARMQSRGWMQLALGGALMILGLIAAPSGAAQRDLTYLEGTDITTLEPARSNSNTDAAVLYLLYEGLTWMDSSGALQPGLASSWTVSPDGLSWKFVLAGGSRFSDGTALTARDVKFSVERLTDAQSTFRSSFSALKGVEAPDDKTVIITTASPFPDLPMLLATRGALIAQRAALEKWGKEYSEHPVGSGPYMLKEFVSGDRLELVPNPHYAGPQKAKAARVIRRVVPEGLARVAGLLRGEGDLALNLPPEAVASVPPSAPIEIRKQPAALGVSFEMNVLKPYLSDRRVRQALNLAVDREAIIKSILLGNGTVQDSPASPGIPGRVKTGPYSYDPAKARELLKAAGVPSDWKLVLWAAPGRYLKDRQVVEAVQGYLRAIGIDAELKLSEWVAYNSEFHKHRR